METLDRPAWERRAAGHAARVDRWVQPHLERRRRGEKHPVHDFLFTYYSHSPAALRRWHPGYGVALLDADPADWGPAYRIVQDDRAPGSPHRGLIRPGLSVSPDHLASKAALVEQVRRLLVATEGRTASYGCFGLHEWAMVHGQSEGETRHAWPLRLGAAATDSVVESHRIACSHFDAYRFFTDSARPLNTLRPGRDDRADFEQPGCLHAGMDLYGKVAVRLSPLIPSELVADAFGLAWDIRVMDMRAAPYDLSGLVLDPSGEEWTPVKIETPEGKQEYVQAQRAFMERGAPIRCELIEWCERLLIASGAT